MLLNPMECWQAIRQLQSLQKRAIAMLHREFFSAVGARCGSALGVLLKPMVYWQAL